jgi:hypothetical protein
MNATEGRKSDVYLGIYLAILSLKIPRLWLDRDSLPGKLSIFCRLHINGLGYTINQGEQASDMTCRDDAVR